MRQNQVLSLKSMVDSLKSDSDKLRRDNAILSG